MKKKTKPIKWETWQPTEPSDFPCLHCNKQAMATVIVTITDNDMEVANLPLCTTCAQLPIKELLPNYKGGKS